MDALDDGLLSGWAIDLEARHFPLRISVVLGGSVVLDEITTRNARSDLDAFVPGNTAGFQLDFATWKSAVLQELIEHINRLRLIITIRTAPLSFGWEIPFLKLI